MNIKAMSKIGIIAAIYGVLTVFLSPFSFGIIQVRLSDAMLVLCRKEKCYVAGCALGCVISNLFSPMGVVDIIFGVVANVVAGLILSTVSGKIKSVISAGVSVGVIIGAELSFLLAINPIITILSTSAGTVLSLLVGFVVFNKFLKGDVIESVNV